MACVRSRSSFSAYSTSDAACARLAGGAKQSELQLSEQCGEEFTSSREVTEYLQQLLEREREADVERDGGRA